mmetsp:Transcript_7371/g.15200  ORF Transcript_7371/g.15200 Transcript_7371/m.15200 type:complete len:86 (+) Transcript_7371:108-365(+)
MSPNPDDDSETSGESTNLLPLSREGAYSAFPANIGPGNISSAAVAAAAASIARVDSSSSARSPASTRQGRKKKHIPVEQHRAGKL